MSTHSNHTLENTMAERILGKLKWIVVSTFLFAASIAHSQVCQIPDGPTLSEGPTTQVNLVQNGSFEDGHTLGLNKWGLFNTL